MPFFPLYRLFWGEQPGAIGEVFIAGILAGGIYLLIKKKISWQAPVSFIVSSWIFSLIFYLVDCQTYPNPFFHILTGGIFFRGIFPRYRSDRDCSRYKYGADIFRHWMWSNDHDYSAMGRIPRWCGFCRPHHECLCAPT